VLARHLEEFGKEIVRALRRHICLLAPLFRNGFGLGDGFLRPWKPMLPRCDAFNCCIGFLAPPAPDFGLANGFLWRVDINLDGRASAVV